MKKILLIGIFTVSVLSFANPHAGHNIEKMNNETTMQCQMMGKMGMMNNMTPQEKIAMEKGMIAIQEKELEVRKLMNTNNTDMKKIEKLNKEIQIMRTNHMESMHKMMTAPATNL